MSNSNHIVISDPSEGSICVAPCIARSLLGCDRLLLPPRYMSQGVISKGLLAMKSLQEYPDSWMFAAEQGVKGVMEGWNASRALVVRAWTDFPGGFGGVQTPPGSGKHPPRKC